MALDERMHFTTEQGDAKTVFRLKEERLDSRNAGQLKAEFLILAQPDIDALIVDLTLVQHIDSAGISALLLASRQMKLHGGELRLVGVRPDVLSMLRLTQLDRIFPLYYSVEEALAAKVVLADDDQEPEPEPNVEESDDLDLALGRKTSPMFSSPKLGPVAPTVSEIKAGAIAAGGSFGAAALAKIMMTPYDDELTAANPFMAIGGPSMGDDEDFEDDDDLDDDDLEDDDLDEEELDDEEVDEDLDEEDDAEEVEEETLEDDDFEDDDFDDEELEEDEEEDY
jgi:anti-sigma B factor antagonist